MRKHLHRGSDGGFTLIELLISTAITGIVAVVIVSGLYVSITNNSKTTQKFNNANDSLTVTNVFPADIASTPPGGREVGQALSSECSGGDAAGSFNVVRLTWSEQASGVTTYYRSAFRILNDSTGAGNLVRVSCTSTTGPHAGYGTGSKRLVASSLIPIPAGWVSGNAPAILSYVPSGVPDGTGVNLALTLDTKPSSTIVVVSGQRSNAGLVLPNPPVSNSTASIQTLTSATESSFATLGTVLHFSTIVLNAGTTNLTSVGIADTLADGGSVNCPTNFLVSGASTTCTFTHTVAQGDLDGGKVTSTTIASGAPPAGGAVNASSAAVVVPAVQSLSMTAVKTVTSTTCLPTACYKAAGDVISYSVTVTNTGNVTLSGLSLADPKMTGGASCGTTTLAPVASTTCAYQYTVVTGDLVYLGSVNTAATVTATAPTSATVTATSGSVSVPMQANPAITATKSSSSATYVAPGQVLNYTIVVTNTGNVSLSAIKVTDSKADVSPVFCAPTPIAPGATSTCSAQHTVTAQDVTNGSVVNVATASATAPGGLGVITATTNSVTVTFNTAPSMSVTKAVTPSPTTFKNVGDQLDYTLTVKNTGGVTLTSVSVTDPKDSDGLIPCVLTTLAPLQTTTCAARHVVVAGDLGNPIVNTATANASSVSGPATATSNTVTVNFVPSPSLTVTLTGSPNPFTTLNAVLTYRMTVQNTGTVALTGVVISQRTLAGTGPPSCVSTTLAVGASTTCSYTYTTTPADSSGSVTNAVTASGTYSGTTYTATSASSVVTSNVPCYVQSIAANASSVARNGGSGNNNQNLAADVAITATTGGATCSGLKIQYYPGNPSSVTANMAGSGSTWTYTIQSNGGSASSWTTTGAKRVDVLSSAGAALATSTGTFFTPFTVTS